MGKPLSGELQRGQVLICGLGLRLEHMTLETLRALKKCDRIYHNFLDRKAAAQLWRLCGVKPADVREPDGKSDSPVMLESILAEAAGGGTAAFLGYGHPLVTRGAPGFLLSRCRAGGIPCRVLASVSSFDDILVAVGAPAMHRGIQVHPAGAVGRRTPLWPDVPAILISLDELWNPGKNGVAGLAKYLGTVYPAGHRMALIRCPHIANNSSLRLETELRGLAAALERLKKAQRQSTSLFIPWLEPAAADGKAMR